MNPEPFEPTQPAQREAWPADPHDRDAPALNEAWHALAQLVRTSGIERLDGVARVRLVQAVERRIRAQRRRRSALFAVAALLLVACGWWITRSPLPGDLARNTPPEGAPVPVPGASPTSAHVEPVRVAPATVVARVSPSAIAAAPGPWSDPLQQDWELVHRQAQDLELEWRRPSDRIAALRDQFEQVEQAWNERSL